MFDASTLGRPLRAEIDLGAYVRNLHLLQNMVGNARLMAVLKADAYGHGVEEMVKSLEQFSGVLDTSQSNEDMILDVAVASSDEANRLIELGVSNRIWILEGPFSKACLNLKAKQDIQWVVHSDWQLSLFDGLDYPLDCWLKIDSGMHRLGFDEQGVERAIQQIQNLPNCNLAGVFTHFACSDDSSSDTTENQLARFEEIVVANGLEALPRSLANSSAIFNFSLTCADIVRPGIASYCPMPAIQLAGKQGGQQNTEAVMSLKSSVIALRTIPKGEGVGYGHRWKAESQTRVATVAVGYGDGYPRHAQNGTPVWINDQVVPLIGRVSMDMITVDVTNLANVKIGDEVELWGARLDINEVAKSAGTISYELLTRVTKRVPKIYLS